MYIEKSWFHFLFRKQCRCLIPMHLVNYRTIYPEHPTEISPLGWWCEDFFFSGLAVRRGKPHEELKKVIDKLGQSSVHSVVFHEEVNALCIWSESLDILTILIYFIFAVNTYHTYIYLNIVCTCINCFKCIHAWKGYCIYHSNDIVTFNTGYSGGIGCGEID